MIGARCVGQRSFHYIFRGISKLNTFLRGSALAGLVLAVGCASKPLPPEYYAGVTNTLAAKKGVMVLSGCATRDEVGSDFILTEVSDAHTELWQKNAAPYLSGYGLPLASAPIRMTCAGYKSPNAKEKVFFAPNKENVAQATPAKLPRIVGAEPALEAATAQNLSDLFLAMKTARMPTLQRKGPPPRAKLKFEAAKLEQLRAATGADYAWLIATEESDVSMGKVVSSAILTAVLTMGTVAMAPAAGRENTIALIDLAEGTVLWRKKDGNAHGTTSATATGTTTAPTYQNQTTSTTSQVPTDQMIAAVLFEPLLPIGQGLAGKGVAPVDAPAPAAPSAPAAPAGASPVAAQ